MHLEQNDTRRSCLYLVLSKFYRASRNQARTYRSNKNTILEKQWSQGKYGASCNNIIDQMFNNYSINNRKNGNTNINDNNNNLDLLAKLKSYLVVKWKFYSFSATSFLSSAKMCMYF